MSDHYRELERVLSEAVAQASEGKGKERHAVDGERFEQQQICQLGRWMGSTIAQANFPIGQACKKAIEATRLDPAKARDELLGAINYMAAAVLLVEEQYSQEQLAKDLREERDPDEDMDRWLAEITEHCRCPPCCQDCPCGGVQQGGVCDGMQCHCEPDDFDEEQEDDDDGK